MQIGSEVSELWSDKQTDRQTEITTLYILIIKLTFLLYYSQYQGDIEQPEGAIGFPHTLL